MGAVHANARNMRVKVIEKLEQNPIDKKSDTDFVSESNNTKPI